MVYYGIFNLIMMVVILAMASKGGLGQSMFWLAVVGEIVIIGLGNLLTYGKLNRSIGRVFFVNQHFSMISVYDILFKKEKSTAFPLIYANPQMDPEQNTLTVHFNDQIITLRRDDWEEFDLMRDYFYAAQY